MASEVEICNLALSNIRSGSINSLNEGSLQAQLCKLKYPIIRDRLLSEIPWGFNRKIEGLSLLNKDTFNWGYTYTYPVDCLKLHRLVGQFEKIQNPDSDVISRLTDNQLLPLRHMRQQIPFEVFLTDGVRVIASNEPDLMADYAYKVEDPNLFTVDFILAFSYLLAAEIAIPLIGAEMGRALRSDSLNIYKQYLDAAIANDMNEQFDEPTISEFESIRR